MKLYFLISSLSTGGAERQVSYLHKEFKESVIICLESSTSSYEIDKRRVISFDSKISNNKLKKIIIFPWLVFKIYRLIQKENKNVTLISFMEYSNFINFILSKFSTFKSIVSVRNTISMHYKSKKIIQTIIFKLSKYVYKNAETIVTNSEGSKQDLIQFGVSENKIIVINNMYNVDSISQKANLSISNEIDRLFEQPTLLSVGRFEYQKGHKHLINIFKNVKTHKKNLKLLLLGEGKLKEELIYICESLNLKVFVKNKNLFSEDFDVYFLGNNEPYAFYKKCTIFMLPSLYEGFPNVLVEASIVGTACIAANCQSGPSELFIDKIKVDLESPLITENGILMPIFNSDIQINKIYTMWENCIIELLNDNERRNEMSKKLKTKSSKYSTSIISQSWSKIIF